MPQPDAQTATTHALNNELATIMATAQLALRELVADGALTPALGDDLSSIIDATRRAARLVGHLRDGDPPTRRRKGPERL